MLIEGVRIRTLDDMRTKLEETQHCGGLVVAVELELPGEGKRLAGLVDAVDDIGFCVVAIGLGESNWVVTQLDLDDEYAIVTLAA